MAEDYIYDPRTLSPTMAGLAAGFWSGTDEIAGAWKLDRRFEPTMSDDRRESLYHGWKEAVKRVGGWARDR